MILENEEQLLDPAIRKKVIEDINSTENKQRKAEMYKRYQCYKDQTYIYVRNELLKQFDPKTVNEMSYALSNIAFLRKVVDKLARVYKYGVERKIEGSDEALSVVEKESDINAAMKKCNRFFKLFKNTLFYTRPMPTEDGLKTIKLTPLAPYLYDVIEMHEEREKALAVILSPYKPELNETMSVRPGTDGRVNGPMQFSRAMGDNVDQTIADSPGDEQDDKYIFWTRNYHFVCNSKGEIISDNDGVNPIAELPFTNFSEDQDGSFWAIGGDDLVHGSILANSMITNVNHIAITQGYGQMVATGKDLPKNWKVGPNSIIMLTHEGGEDPEPKFGFESANPPLDQLRGLIEMYVALLLTTNNLSTSGVQSNLNGAAAFPSGIAMMLDKAESMEDVEDQRQVFIDNEPHIWRIYSKWHKLLKASGELPEELAAIDLPDDPDVKLIFGQPKAIESEKDRLEVLKMKRDLGIISMIDIIKEEYDGNLSDEEAEMKLKEIMEEKLERMMAFTGGSQGQQSNLNEDDSANRPGDESSDSDEAGGRGVPNRANPIEGSGEEEPSNG